MVNGKEETMDTKTIELDVGGGTLEVRVTRDGKTIARHTLHAVGASGSLAYFKGGPGSEPTEPPSTRTSHPK